ncbi:MAG: hypothetical protein RML73_00830 [Anaerolineae bacterium]|nr:hypothetical protein [Anaerolineae bacterium]
MTSHTCPVPAENRLHLSWPVIISAALIVLLAFGLRVIVIAERAVGGDDRFIPPPLTDMHTYYESARLVASGGTTVLYQPGVVYWYALGLHWIGDDPALLMMFVALGDSLAVGALLACGWLLLRNPAWGLGVGLLAALYPVAVFYGTTLLIEPFAVLLLALSLWLWLWQRESLTWWRSLALGLLLGLISITRFNLVSLGVAYGLWLMMDRKTALSLRLIHLSLCLGLALLIYLPINTAADVSWQLYSANNRDASGLGGNSIAYDAAELPYSADLWRDIRIAPWRFAGLVARKIIAAWDNVEVGNNLDYEVIRSLSPTLARLPGDFSLLALLGLMGLGLLWVKDLRLGIGLGLLLLAVTLSIGVSFALSRFRYPLVPMLILLAVLTLQTCVYALRTRYWQNLKPALLVLPFALLLTQALPAWGLRGTPPPLPSKPSYATLPEDAIALGLRFGEELELVGWRRHPAWQAAQRGYIDVGQAYAVELFWRALQPPASATSSTSNTCWTRRHWHRLRRTSGRCLFRRTTRCFGPSERSSANS